MFLSLFITTYLQLANYSNIFATSDLDGVILQGKSFSEVVLEAL